MIDWLIFAILCFIMSNTENRKTCPFFRVWPSLYFNIFLNNSFSVLQKKSKVCEAGRINDSYCYFWVSYSFRMNYSRSDDVKGVLSSAVSLRESQCQWTVIQLQMLLNIHPLDSVDLHWASQRRMTVLSLLIQFLIEMQTSAQLLWAWISFIIPSDHLISLQCDCYKSQEHHMGPEGVMGIRGTAV